MCGVESDIVTLWLAPVVTSSALIGGILSSLFLITKLGRRTLALGSLAGMLLFSFTMFFVTIKYGITKKKKKKKNTPYF